MNQFCFGKERRLLSLRDFNHLRRKARMVSSPYFRAYYKKTLRDAQHTRVGFAVSKKVGNAVVRNAIKRCLREEFRLSSYREKGLDVLFVVFPSVRRDFLLKGQVAAKLSQKFRSLLSRVFEEKTS